MKDILVKDGIVNVLDIL